MDQGVEVHADEPEVGTGVGGDAVSERVTESV